MLSVSANSLLHSGLGMPDRYGIKEGKWHSDKLCITNGMQCRAPGRACDDIEFAYSITLTMLSEDPHATAFILDQVSQSTVDDDVKTITRITRPPEYLTCVDLCPVERGIDLKNYRR